MSLESLLEDYRAHSLELMELEPQDAHSERERALLLASDELLTAIVGEIEERRRNTAMSPLN
jgi:hypothetical protein